MTHPRPAAIVLSMLALAFAGRVLGQAAVAFDLFARLGLDRPEGWPPMQAWYSGLIPYPALFPLQLMILGFMGWHTTRWLGRDTMPTGRQLSSRWLFGLGLAYALIMLTRYAIAIGVRARFGDPWWAGGLIPVCFHQVLAGYLMVWGLTLRQRDTTAQA